MKDSMKRVEANAEFEALYEKHEKEGRRTIPAQKLWYTIHQF
jgi:hypothetical protein